MEPLLDYWKRHEHVIFSSGATFQGVLDAKAMLCPLDTTLIGDIRIKPSKPREIFTPTIVIIAGGTASGKTSIAEDFAQKHDCLIIHHDRYYKDILFPPDANFDEPDALDNELLVEHLSHLKQGHTVELPIYASTSKIKRNG